MLCGDDILAENANEKHYETLLAKEGQSNSYWIDKWTVY